MTETPDPIDVYVGARLRALRLQRKLSQSELAQALGLTFQQIQKYERGSNRISASKLLRAAEYLQAPVASLFPDSTTPDLEDVRLVSLKHGAELIEAFEAMPSNRRTLLVEIAREMAGTSD